MHFYIDYATPEFVYGWLAPDNPSQVPRFRVQVDDLPCITLPASIYRPDLVEAKLHDTGLVGFRFDDSNVPRFSQAREISITETTNNRMIFRRSAEKTAVNKKVFLFNNIPVPNRFLRRGLGQQFLLSYPAIDSIGIESALSLLGNNRAESLFSEGRLNVSVHFQKLSEAGYHLAALLVDPLTELANRLLVVKTVLDSTHGLAALQSLSPPYSSLRNCVERLEQFSETGVNSAFSDLTPEERNAVNDPLTRWLACSANEEPEPRHVSPALGLLAEFHSVGVAEELETFKKTLVPQVPGVDLTDLEIVEIEGSRQLREALSQSATVRKLLRNDCRLHQYVASSIVHATAP